MATRKKPKKLTKEPAVKFVANDPKDEPQAEGVNRFVEEWGKSFERAAQSTPKSPWMKIQEAHGLIAEALKEVFKDPLTATEGLVAVRCRRLLNSSNADLVAAAEYLEWVNQSRDARLGEIRRQHNAAVGGRCLEPADLATSTWWHTGEFSLATDKDD